jgi:hypothetical protein
MVKEMKDLSIEPKLNETIFGLERNKKWSSLRISHKLKIF